MFSPSRKAPALELGFRHTLAPWLLESTCCDWAVKPRRERPRRTAVIDTSSGHRHHFVDDCFIHRFTGAPSLGRAGFLLIQALAALFQGGGHNLRLVCCALVCRACCLPVSTFYRSWVPFTLANFDSPQPIDRTLPRTLPRPADPHRQETTSFAARTRTRTEKRTPNQFSSFRFRSIAHLVQCHDQVKPRRLFQPLEAGRPTD